MKERGRFRRILPVIAAPVALGMLAGSCVEPRAEAALTRQTAVTVVFPEATTTTVSIQQRNTVFPSVEATELSAVGPLMVPTATEMRKSLPKSVHPDFVYENDEQKKKDIPSFMTIGPVIFTGVIHSEPGDDEKYETPAGVGQKYLGFRSTQKDPRTGLYFNFWLSFSNYKPEELAPLLEFEKNNSAKDLYRVRFPIAPHKEYRQATQLSYQHSLGLTAEEAAEYEKACLEGAWAFTDDLYADNYFTTFSTGSISKT